MGSGWGDGSDNGPTASAGATRAEERTQWLLDTLNDRKAAETFAALHYWVRAIRYEPTQEEREVLKTSEDRAALYSGAGEIVGVLAGMAGSRALSLPRPHAMAVTLSGALVGEPYTPARRAFPAI